MSDLADHGRFAMARQEPAYAAAMARDWPDRWSGELRDVPARIASACVLFVLMRLRAPMGVVWVVIGATHHRYDGIMLRVEGDRPHWFPAARRARVEAQPGAVGVAYFRHEVMIAFARLDA
jgi:hypothetical protein